MPLRTAVLALGLVLLAGSSWARDARLGKTLFENTDYGFELRGVEDFTAVPAKDDPYLMLKLFGREDYTRDGSFQPEGHVVWIPKDNGDIERRLERLEGLPEELIEHYRKQLEESKLTGAWAWCEERFRQTAKIGREQKLKINVKRTPPGKKRPKKTKIDATWFTFTRSSGWRGITYKGAALIVPTEEGEFGVFYAHVDEKFEDYQKAFLQSFATFSLIDREITDAELEQREKDKVNEFDGEAFRRAHKAELAEGWKALDTPNYLIVHHIDEKDALEIGKRLESCRALYERMFPPKHDKKAVSVVRVCKDRDEYHQYGGPGGSAGYWSRADKELVFYEAQGSKDTFAVLHHEAFHQFIYYFYGDLAPHSWYNEGHGDYFSGVQFDKSHRPVKGKPFAWRKGTVKEAHRTGGLVPLEEFIRYTQRQYYTRPDLCYSQGWAFIYFLRTSDDVRRHPQWSKILETYMETLWQEYQRRRGGEEDESEDAEGEDEDKGGETKRRQGSFASQFQENEEMLAAAVDAAFSGIDMEELERAFHAFIEDSFKN